MSDYKRLVSYIYRYYKEEKQQNIGYGRIETRNGQCKITVYIQAAGYVDMDLKMYFLKREGNILWGIPAGTVKMQNGTGECKIVTSSENLMGSGVTLLDTAGILIRGNSDIYFASEWDEKPVSIANFKEYGSKEENVLNEPPDKSPEKEEPPSGIKEEAKEVEQPPQNPELVSTEELKAPQAAMKKEEAEKREQKDYWKLLKEALMTQENSTENREESVDRQEERVEIPSEENNGHENREPEEWRQERERSKNSGQSDDEQRKTEEFIQRIFNTYSEINPFEGEEVTRSVRFEPKDIGLLPMENWILGNNSFLLQGYYQYHHLIFAEKSEGGEKTYFLGVPGVNVEKERFLAGIFGFKNFISTQKNKSQVEGAYGYWYKSISFTSA